MRLKGFRVLLVEDAPDIREVFAALLRSEGAEVTATASGRRAIEEAARKHFDIVLTDLGLPDVHGEVVIRDVLARSRPRPRVFAITGYGDPYPSRARAAGADAVLLKPAEWDDIVDAIVATPASAVA